jgi:hemolysin activation/secretion protein
MVEVVGNTVLQDEIDTLTRSFENREVTFEDLVALRTEITQLYIQNGYVTSGAFLPNNQDLSSGVVQIQVVEGELERIDISGLRHLRTAYVRDRIELGTSNPLNQYKLQESLQLLQLNPLIRSVNAELTAGSAPGRSILLVNVVEAPSFHVGVGGNNYQSPSIGSEQISVSVEHGNVLGFGDRLSAGYGLTDGLDSFNVSYAIPINSLDGTLNLSYNNDESTIIADDFADLDIRSESETFSINFRQPLSKSPTSEFALGLGLDLRRSQTYSVSHIG